MIRVTLGPAVTGWTVYVWFKEATTAGTVWNGSAFVAYTLSARNLGAVNMTEIGSTGVWEVAIPNGLAGKRVAWIASRQLGGSKVESDTIIGDGFYGGVEVTDASFGWELSDTPGVPTTTIGRLRRYVDRWFNRKVRNRVRGTETQYASNGTTPLHVVTQATTSLDGETIDTATVGAP